MRRRLLQPGLPSPRVRQSYHYFSGKRELFMAVITESAERMIAATEPDMTLDPMDRLHASLGAHPDYAVEHAAGYTALLRISGAPPPEPALTLRGWVGMVGARPLA